MPITRQQMFDGKSAESIVCSELLKRGLAPFIPLLDDGIDIIVKTKNNKLYELQVKSNNSPIIAKNNWDVFVD